MDLDRLRPGRGGNGQDERERSRLIDRQPLTAEQQQLFDDYLRQWTTPMKPFCTVYPRLTRAALASGLSREDLEQVLFIGVTKALKRFDPAYGASFATYALNRMRGAVSHFLAGASRQFRNDPNVKTLSGDLPFFDDGTGRIFDDLGTNDPPPRDEHVAVKDAMRFLSPRERQLIELRFGFTDGVALTLEEIADQLGVTPERIRQLEEKAKSKVWRCLRRAGADTQIRDELGVA